MIMKAPSISTLVSTCKQHKSFLLTVISTILFNSLSQRGVSHSNHKERKTSFCCQLSSREHVVMYFCIKIFLVCGEWELNRNKNYIYIWSRKVSAMSWAWNDRKSGKTKIIFKRSAFHCSKARQINVNHLEV